MSEINGVPRPPFFPNSPSAKKARDARKMQKLLESRRNSAERTKEINDVSKKHTKVDINDKVRDFSRIKAAVDNAPDIDNSEKIAKLKSQIKNGEYKVDYEALADKIITSEY